MTTPEPDATKQLTNKGPGADSVLVGPGLESGDPDLIEQQMMVMGGMADPIAAKLTDSHITNLIANDESTSKRNHSYGIIRLVALVLVLIIVLAFVVLFCYLFATSSPQLVEKVLIGVISFAGGIGAGLGAPILLGKFKDD